MGIPDICVPAVEADTSRFLLDRITTDPVSVLDATNSVVYVTRDAEGE